MAFRVPLMSAPERRGIIADPSAWAGASTSVVTSSGLFTGDYDATFTVTGSIGGGTVGTGAISVTWSDGLGNTGEFDLGAKYTAGDSINIKDGISLQFAAGTIAASADSFTMDVNAANRVRGDHVTIEGDADPVDVFPSSFGIIDDDIHFKSDDGRTSMGQIAQRVTTTMSLDYLEDADVKKLEAFRAGRYPVVVAGNYGQNTTLWYSGSGELPLVGQRPAIIDTAGPTAGAGRDAETGLYTVAASGTPRYGPGVEMSTRSVGNSIDRDGIPLEFAHMGKALILGDDSTNLIPNFHPESGTIGWTVVAAGSVVFDDQMPPVLDPTDAGWSGGYREGSARAYLSSGQAIKSTTAAVTATNTYTAQAWIKAPVRDVSGVLWSLAVYSGVGVPASSAGSVTMTSGSMSAWRRVALRVTIPATHTAAELRVVCTFGVGIVYVSGAQLELNDGPTELIETSGASASRSAQTFKPVEMLPNVEGSIAFWLFYGDGNTSSTYEILGTYGGATVFKLDYRAVTAQALEWHTDATGVGNALSYGLGAIMIPGSWYHIALTWEAGYGTMRNEMTRTIYLDGAQVAQDSSAQWQEWTDPWKFGHDSLGGSPRIQDVRLDRVAWTSDEVSDMYDRLATSQGAAIARRFTGRTFRISQINSTWLSPANPDKYLTNLTLEEMDRDDGSVTVRA